MRVATGSGEHEPPQIGKAEKPAMAHEWAEATVDDIRAQARNALVGAPLDHTSYRATTPRCACP